MRRLAHCLATEVRAPRMARVLLDDNPADDAARALAAGAAAQGEVTIPPRMASRMPHEGSRAAAAHEVARLSAAEAAAAARVARAARVGSVARDVLMGGPRRPLRLKGEEPLVLDALYKQWVV